MFRARHLSNVSIRRTVLSHFSTFDAPTSAIRKAHKFDEGSVLSYLRSKGVIEGSGSIQQFSHGQSNPTFVYRGGDRQIVIRKQPPGKLLKGAHAVDREFRVMSALQSTSVPVPKMLLYCEDSAVMGTPFYCYDFVEGRFFKEPALAAVESADKRRAMYNSMLDTLARIHAVDVDAAGLGDYGTRVNKGKGTDRDGKEAEAPAPYVIRQVKTWTKQYRATETEPIPEMEYLMKNLPRLLPPGAEERSCLVHGDFRLDNMIFHRDTDSVKAVLDWELSTLGDANSDLAYNLIVHYLHPKNPFLRGLKGLDLPALGIPSVSEAVSYYAKRLEEYSKRAMKGPSESVIRYYLAFSFFRSCAILQGVYKRSLMGNASAENAGAALAFAKETAAIGCELLREYEGEVSPSGHHSGNSSSSGGGHVRAGSVAPSPPFSSETTMRTPKMHLFRGSISPRAAELISSAETFIRERVLPHEHEILSHTYEDPKKWTEIHPKMEELKAEAKAKGLWNLFLPVESDPQRQYGAGLTNLEYALIAEMTGRTIIAPEIFNCNAPDTGNMEVLVRYGSEKQKQQWLAPLLQGEIRSCFAMTEPEVASSDATNMRATIQRDGDHVILNGRKWWTSGAMDPRCKVAIFMGRTAGDLSAVPRHLRHSMVLVPMDAPGVHIVRPLRVMGYDDAPHGHAEMLFDNVRVPAANVILGEGRGFEIAQGRLGPGRIHHCMRLIGVAERALELMVARATQRVAFGKHLAEQGTIQEDIALSRVEIDQTRLLCLDAAAAMDHGGNKEAKKEIAAIKIAAPRMAKQVVDRAIQCFGGMGMSQDTPLAHLWTTARVLQLADGPDQVHIAAVAKQEIKQQQPNFRPAKPTK